MSEPSAKFHELYVAELAYVLQSLRRLGVADADVEDAAHDVFVTAYRRRDDRDEARPVRAWLFGIAYRVVGNRRQKAYRRREVASEAVPAIDARPTPEEALVRHEQREILLDALATLDLKQRAVAVLYEIEGMAAPAIAATLGIPLNTVYSRARAARQRLLELTREQRGELP